MAHKKGQGSSRNGRDSNPQMLGIKLFGGQTAKPGSIICRQKGTKWHPGKNVGVGRDWTIFSLIDGKVTFDQDGRRINVLPAAEPRRRAERRELIGTSAPLPHSTAAGLEDCHVRRPSDDLRARGRRGQRLPQLSPREVRAARRPQRGRRRAAAAA